MKKLLIVVVLFCVIFIICACTTNYDQQFNHSPSPLLVTPIANDALNRANSIEKSEAYIELMERDIMLKSEFKDEFMEERLTILLPDFPIYLRHMKNDLIVVQLFYITESTPKEVNEYYEELVKTKKLNIISRENSDDGEHLLQLKNDEGQQLTILISQWDEINEKKWANGMKGMWKNGVTDVRIWMNLENR